LSPRGDAGSVLVDALVAVSIMAITVALAGTAVGDGALRSRAAEQARLAQLEARSRLDEVGGDIPLTVGQASGVDGEIAWSVDITPGEGGDGRLLHVSAAAGPRGRAPMATLNTLRLGPA
jgi:hypothetical protein